MYQGRKGITDRIRRHWPEGPNGVWLKLAVVVVAAYAVTSVGLMQQPTYEASAHVLVGWQQEGRLETLEFREPLIQTIAPAIDSRPVAKEAIRRLELEMTPTELLDSLTVEQVENTSFIVLSYEGTNPHRAQRIVNTVGEVFSEFTAEGDNTLEANVYDRAALPATPVSPRPVRNGLLTLIVGLSLAVALPNGLPRSLAAGAAQIALGLVEFSKSRVGRALTVVRTRLAARWRVAPREVEAAKEQELLEALWRCGRLTALGAALETSLSVHEAERMLHALAARGHLEVTVEGGRLMYSFWEDRA